ncbi:MAG: ferritin [Endomicrobium sp.]|jgi:ferritin|nr:ferritin [Endomicrobium sp.]
MTGKFSERMYKALNEQIRNEYFSAYLYLSMSACCYAKNLTGMAHWFRVQYEEELSHGDKIFKYITERGAKVELLQIDRPPCEWASALEMYKNALTHEQYVTGLINNLVKIAGEDKDYATLSFLQWFVDEQVEEEANDEAIIAQLEMIGESKGSLLFLDRQLGKRKED